MDALLGEPSARVSIDVTFSRVWDRLVSDRSDELRKTARECLELAHKTTDATTRAVLVTIAQRSLDLASGSAGDDQLNAVLQEYNDRKMSEH